MQMQLAAASRSTSKFSLGENIFVEMFMKCKTDVKAYEPSFYSSMTVLGWQPTSFYWQLACESYQNKSSLLTEYFTTDKTNISMTYPPNRQRSGKTGSNCTPKQ